MLFRSEYCDTTIARKDAGSALEDLGRISHVVDDASPLRIGAAGKFGGVEFLVIGRLQVEHEAGFWNEWFLSFGGEATGWMGEAQGNYTISFVTAVAEPIPPFAELAVGRKLQLAGTPFEVRDLESARVTGLEGELPFDAKRPRTSCTT